VLERWLEQLPPAPRLLEVGPGTGQLALYVEALGAHVSVIDLSAENVAYCRQRGLSASVGDVRALGHASSLGLFDGVYAINVLLHVPRAEHAATLAGIRCHLVPGGGVLLVNWGGIDSEGVWEQDHFVPRRFFSLYDDAQFASLAFEGFEVTRRELLSEHARDGMHPQLLALRRVPLEAGEASPQGTPRA
jgi:cyclopropane fatty-acyl-phospholipid synthase-like methyltransferase